MLSLSLISVDFFFSQLATDVLETLLDEDDEVPDVWYLLGWANYLQGSEYYSNSRHYLQKGKEVDCLRIKVMLIIFLNM